MLPMSVDEGLLHTPCGVAVDTAGAVWSIGQHGVDKYDGTFWSHWSTAEATDATQFEFFDLMDVKADRDGRVWVSSEKGLSVFDNTQLTIIPASEASANAYPGYFATKMCFDSSGSHWIACGNLRGREPVNPGLARWDGTTWWYYTNTNSGLPSNMISDIQAAKDGTIWIATDKGIALLDGNAAPIRAFTTSVEATTKPITPVIMQIIPNPTSGYATVTINVQKSGQCTVALYDLLGHPCKNVFSGLVDAGNRSLSIDVSGVQSGLYILRVLTNAGIGSQQMSILR